MAKRGNHKGFVQARVNANVEGRGIIADSLDVEAEIPSKYDCPLPDTCVNAEGACCPCCDGCVCPPNAQFIAQFNARYGKPTRFRYAR